MSANLENVMVKITRDGGFYLIRAYDRVHKNRGRFLVFAKELDDWLCHRSQERYIDHDCRDFLTMRIVEDFCYITWARLTETIGNDLKGYRQNFKVPVSQLVSLVIEGKEVRYLSEPDIPKAKINVANASRVIQRIEKDKLKRRALSKAMRDKFCWHNSSVSLYSDGKYDFFFRENEGDHTMSGGLILSYTIILTGAGYKEKLYYECHT